MASKNLLPFSGYPEVEKTVFFEEKPHVGTPQYFDNILGRRRVQD